MLGLAHRGFSLKDYKNHIVNMLNEDGYATALCGIQHVADTCEKIGYKRNLDDRNFDMSQDFSFDTIEYDTSNARKASEYILKQKSDDKPFFLSFGMFNTHRVFPPVDPDVNPDYIHPPYPLKDIPSNRDDFAGYITSARIVDNCIGTVMKALDAAGLREDTIVIFTTDHGLAFPGMKCTLYDTGIGVTMILDYPGNQKKGAVSDALVSHIDIYPTLCELTGIEKPDWLEGTSLLPLFKDDVNSVREEIFAEVTYHAAYEPMRCIRTDRYKLIKRFDSNISVISSNMDDCSGKDLLLESGYGNMPYEKEMLFDLNIDPLEKNNLIKIPEYMDVYKDLSLRLSSWMIETEDPLLCGPVPLPAGAFANKQSCISPNEQEFDYGE
jgi:arylsulfatase A-like enzyme